jgi:hypothetical protein
MRRLDRRSFLQQGALGALALGTPWPAALAGEEPGGETLYNGIRLPSPWPPKDHAVTQEPPSAPYLASPPSVIPIDVGRQLFVDDFLIESTTLQRAFHQAEYHPATPVLKPDKPWEQEGNEGATAMVFSDGVWHDPQDRLFKMWYMGGYTRSTCYATSTDGLHWDKPALDVRPGTNIVQPDGRDSTTVWLDQEEKDPQRRYKLFRSHSLGEHWGLTLHFSADGIHWSAPALNTGSCGDRSTAFWNPFRKVWVYSLRHGWGRPRRRRYWETRDLLAGPQWVQISDPPMWAGADRLDLPREDLKTPPELYNLDCVAYESVLLGMWDIWRGQPGDRPKPNELCVGFSRDGFHWDRPTHQAFIPVSERYGDWNWGNVQSAGGCCLVVGDRLYFYVSGRAGVRGTSKSGVSTTGLATLRRDGFASMDAGAAEGTLTTRPVRFQGKHCFVNADTHAGELRAEILDERGKVIPPFSRAHCGPLHSDGTAMEMRWKGARDLSALAGKEVRFRFYLANGAFYAFWVSPGPSGASHGYVAAGGPGFTGPTDTVGAAARS